MWRIRIYTADCTDGRRARMRTWVSIILFGAGVAAAVYLALRQPAGRRRTRIPLAPAQLTVQPAGVEADAEPDEGERLLYSTVVDQRPVELPVLYYVLKKVRGMTAQQLRSLADSTITYESYVDSPKLCRGRVDRVAGTLFRLKRTELHAGNASGLTRVWEGQIIDRNLDTYSFYLTDDPGPFEIKRDVVALYGVFLKIIVYTNRTGEPFPSPLLVGRSLVRIDEKRTPTRRRLRAAIAGVYQRSPVLVILLGLSCLAFVTLTCLAVRWENRKADARVRRLRRRGPAEP